jgi:predicted transcriptional regulator
MVYGIIPTSIKLEPALKGRIKKLGEVKQRKPHAIMKEAICIYLEHEEKNERLLQEITQRWRAAESNNTIDHNAVCNWLTTWSTDNKSENPAWLK